MGKGPSGQQLLKTALKVFREELLPELTEKKRYSGLMVANALGILTRQLNRNVDDQVQEESALVLLLEEQGSIESLHRLFAKRIRNGDFMTYSKTSIGAWEVLFKITQANVEESNPKYLEE